MCQNRQIWSTSQPLFRQRRWVASPVRFTTITMGPQAKREASRRDTGWGDRLSQLEGSDALGLDGGGDRGRTRIYNSCSKGPLQLISGEARLDGHFALVVYIMGGAKTNMYN